MLRACAAHGAALVPQGGNTGLVGASVPDASGTQVLLALSRLDRIRAIDAANLTLTAEAGCVLQKVQEAAAEAGLLFPLSLAAEGSCTIGGNLATNAGGTQVLRYGNARDLCLGLEVVTARRRAVGRAVGPAQGQHRLRAARPLHRQRRHARRHHRRDAEAAPAAGGDAPPRFAACPRLEDAVELLKLARARLGAALTGFEVMNAHSLALVAQAFPAAAPAARRRPAVAVDGARGAVATPRARRTRRRCSRACSRRRWKAAASPTRRSPGSIAQSRAMWHLRESIPLAQAEEGLNIKHDIALTVSRIPAFVESTDAALRAPSPASCWSTSAT